MPASNNPKPRFRFARRDDIDRIVELDRRYLPEDTVVAEDVFCAWHQANPEIFRCLIVDGRICGYYSVLPLARTALEQFVAGTLAEKDFTAGDILTRDEVPVRCDSLYFYSIVLDAPYRSLIGEMLRELAAQLEDYGRRQPLRRVYATAATDAGRRLIERLGFTLRTSGGQRADGHDLYALDGDAIGQLSQRAMANRAHGAVTPSSDGKTNTP